VADGDARARVPPARLTDAARLAGRAPGGACRGHDPGPHPRHVLAQDGDATPVAEPPEPLGDGGRGDLRLRIERMAAANGPTCEPAPSRA